jgi:hypothetical protein
LKQNLELEIYSPFARLISYQPAVLFSHNKPAINNQPAVLFSQNTPAPAISHQPTEQAANLVRLHWVPKVTTSFKTFGQFSYQKLPKISTELNRLTCNSAARIILIK